MATHHLRVAMKLILSVLKKLYRPADNGWEIMGKMCAKIKIYIGFRASTHVPLRHFNLPRFRSSYISSIDYTQIVL